MAMKREEFYKEIELLKEKIGMWQIVTEELDMADFVLGYYFDDDSKQWKVYINNEKGRHRVRLETSSEEKALDKLYDMISVKAEVHTFNKRKFGM